jgi:hypothetical protein
VLIRSLTGQLLVPVLVALLVLTTPVGTGEGVHESELLHPLLPHAHLIDGRIVSDAQLALVRAAAAADNVTRQAHSGLSIGAGNGADAVGLGIALAPSLPVIGLSIASGLQGWLPVSESGLPTEFLDAPDDPPPNPFA